jgi:hypothetical protein
MTEKLLCFNEGFGFSLNFDVFVTTFQDSLTYSTQV